MKTALNSSRLNLSTTCRACLDKDGPFTNIHESNIYELYTKITEIQVYGREGLPQVFCISCIEALKYIKKFIELCKASEESICKNIEESTLKDKLEPVVGDLLEILGDVESLKDAEIEESEETETKVTRQYILEKEEKLAVEDFYVLLDEDDVELEEESAGEVVENDVELQSDIPESSTFVQGTRNKEEKLAVKDLIDILEDEDEDDPSELNVPDSQEKDIKINNISNHRKLDTKPKKSYVCGTCGATFALQGFYERHFELNKDCKKRHYECVVCHKIFAKRCKLEVHKRTHTGETPFQCDICLNSFKERRYLQRHVINMHTDNKLYRCRICGKDYLDAALRDEHTKSAHSTHCHYCDSDFKSYGSLQYHLSKFHTPGGIAVKCPECDKTISSKGSLRRHMILHNGGAKAVCNVCGKTFLTNGELRDHYRQHTGEKPYKCSYCDKCFAVRTGLKVHERSHTNAKPYRCVVCGTSFRQSSTLRRHELSHTGERPYACTMCDKKYADSMTLKKHLRTHTGERPYACTACGKAYHGSYSCKRHEVNCRGKAVSIDDDFDNSIVQNIIPKNVD